MSHFLVLSGTTQRDPFIEQKRRVDMLARGETRVHVHQKRVVVGENSLSISGVESTEPAI